MPWRRIAVTVAGIAVAEVLCCVFAWPLAVMLTALGAIAYAFGRICQQL